MIIEQQEVIRQGLSVMLSSIPAVSDWRYITSTSELDEAADFADVVLVSVPAVKFNGREIGTPKTVRTIMLVPSATSENLDIATAVRADGYMMMADVNVDTLTMALAQVRNDTMPLPRVISSYLLRRTREDDLLSQWRSVRLTPRELDVLELLAAGHSNKQIAAMLKISIHSAKRYVSSILHKFDSPSRSHIISMALKTGLISGQQRDPGR